MPAALQNTAPVNIECVELSNSRGDSIQILTLGGIIREWHVAMSKNEPVNIVLGYPHNTSYLHDTAYHGAITGRYCNRIANSQYSLNGASHHLTSNEGPHQLHGGPIGFSKRLWTIKERTKQSLTLSLFSEEGDQGHPGNLQIQICYTLDDNGHLDIQWQAESDQDTYVSLTSHAYFNLAGCGDICDHDLQICADQYTPQDASLIPTGAISDVTGSILDLRNFHRLGDIVSSEDPEILSYGGLDHNWAFACDGQLKTMAQLRSHRSGLRLTVKSTLPGLQCYSGNHLQANGIHGCHEGLCLEPQYYPDSPNRPDFPSPLLRQGQTMSHTIRYEVVNDKYRHGRKEHE